MNSREQTQEETRKQLALMDLIWYYQDKETNARTGHRGLAYRFVWIMLKHKEVFEAVESINKALKETNIYGVPMTPVEKKQVYTIYREALKKIEKEKLA